jgi:transcriptional regulator with XRE-family HTH domain
LSTTLAQRIDLLFKTCRNEDGKEFTYVDVQTGSNKAVTAPYVWKLRTGEAQNPSLRVMKALSAFFGVPCEYFFGDDVTQWDTHNLRLAHGLRQAGLAEIALSASELDREGRQIVLNLIDHMRQLRGQS